MGLLLGCVLGSMMSSSSTTEINHIQSQEGELYVNREAIARVKNPMSVRLSCTGRRTFYDDEKETSLWGTFAGLFEHVRPDKQDYAVLRITRVLSGDSPTAYFWFEFVLTNELNPSP